MKYTFNEKLKTLRLNYRDKNGLPKKISIRMAAEMIREAGHEISHGGYARWEQPGNAIPTRSAIQAICKVFNCQPADLFEEFYGGKGKSTPRKEEFRDIDILNTHDYELLKNLKDTLIAATIAREEKKDKKNE
jgi:transcriptional regulator with XRE-family HTH domain